MSVNNRKGPIFDPGLCRCCGSTKKCRLLNVEYEWLGQKEIYSDMIMDCFGLLLSHLDGEPEERLVCATCVVRLREACSFRRQVLQCEEKLLQSKIHVHVEGTEINNEIKVEMEDVKEERRDSHSDAVMDDDVMDTANNVDSDADEVKEESLNIEKELKLEKKLSKMSGKRRAKSSRGEHLKARKEMLVKMKRIGEKLKKMEHLDSQNSLVTDQSPSRSASRPRFVDNEHKAFRNTVTVVENSYVCPFDTSFSDYYCVYCRDVFTDPGKLREHTLNHDPTTFKDIVTNKKIPQIDVDRIDCRLCPVKIDDLESFKSHITSVHGKCLYTNVTNEFLKFRLTLNNLTCTECNSSFGFFHALKKHMAEHFGTCICDICGAHYFEERMLIIHQKTHQRVDENFPCKECGKSFKSKHSRYLHVARMHKKEPAYQCSKCDAVLFSYTLRYRHMIEVHGEQRMFPCEHCDRAYDSRKSLREHNRRSHLKIFKHQCDLCDKRFYLPSRLKEHMATHTGERNFRCEYCGKSYPRLRGLKVHMQSHSNEKKFRCMMCNASFTQNVNLKNHMKRQHQSLEMEESFHE